MIIKEAEAERILDSSKKETIKVIIITLKGEFKTSAPSGESRGKHEVKPYLRNLKSDIKIINRLDISNLNNIINKYYNDKAIGIEKSFRILKDIEKKIKNKIGGNTLFALEASLLKAIAYENKKELWEFLGGKKENIKKIKPVGNVIEGGVHSKGIKGRKPDFQEFLFIPKCKDFRKCMKLNRISYNLIKKSLKARKRSYEGGWTTGLNNEEILDVMKKIQ